MDEQNVHTETAFPSAKRSEQMIGPIIGGVILLITFLVAMYFWLGGDAPGSTSVEQPAVGQPMNTPQAAQQQAAADPVVAEFSSQGTSDELTDIEADLKATNLDSLGEYMEEI